MHNNERAMTNYNPGSQQLLQSNSKDSVFFFFRSIKITVFTLLLSCLLACSPTTDVIVDRDNLRISQFIIGSSNVYLVERDNKRFLIDSANPGDGEVIAQRLRMQGVEPETIDYLILTHGHIDHAGSAAYFQDKWKVKIIGGKLDQPIIDNAGRAEVCPTSLLAHIIRWTLSGLQYQPFTLDIAVEGDFDLAGLGVEGELLFLPGHTPGSLVARFDEYVFVGDLIRGAILLKNTPATHFFMCDLAENRQRIQQLLDSTGEANWYPGHLDSFSASAVRDYLADQLDQ